MVGVNEEQPETLCYLNGVNTAEKVARDEIGEVGTGQDMQGCVAHEECRVL